MTHKEAFIALSVQRKKTLVAWISLFSCHWLFFSQSHPNGTIHEKKNIKIMDLPFSVIFIIFANKKLKFDEISKNRKMSNKLNIFSILARTIAVCVLNWEKNKFFELNLFLPFCDCRFENSYVPKCELQIRLVCTAVCICCTVNSIHIDINTYIHRRHTYIRKTP